MKNRLYLLVILIIMVILSLQGHAAPQTGRFEVKPDTLGGTFTLAVYVPEDYDSSLLCPMTIAFHGYQMQPETMRDLLYNTNRKIGSIIFCPDMNDITSSDVFFARLLKSISYIISNYKIEKTKVITAGFSSGVYYAYNIALTNPETFKGSIGIAPLVMAKNIQESSWANIKQVRLAAIVGKEDDNFPIVDKLMDEVESRGGTAKYIIKEETGHINDDYINSKDFIVDYVNCYQFLFASPNEVLSGTENSLKVRIGPNPASDYIFVETTSGSPSAAITIVNQSGIAVYNSIFENRDYLREKIDLSSLANGVYFISVRSGSNCYTGKFIKSE